MNSIQRIRSGTATFAVVALIPVLHGGRHGRGLSVSTIRYIHAVLHKALTDAVRTGTRQGRESQRSAPRGLTIPVGSPHDERAAHSSSSRALNALASKASSRIGVSATTVAVCRPFLSTSSMTP